MIEIARILCPVDFSEFSRHAVDHAVAVGHWYGSAITALHVMPPPAALIPAGDVGIYPPLVYTPVDREQFRAELQKIVTEESGSIPIAVEVVEGNVTVEIVRRAETLPADLVVMGTHGRSGFERLILGSTAERTLRRAPCPVLTVPRRAPDAVPAAPGLFKHILCAVDFSPSSDKALTYAASLAKEADAALTLLHVVELWPTVDPIEMGASGGAALDQHVMDTAYQRLHESVSDEMRTYCSVTEVVTSGKAYREILRHAQDERSELIVVGAHGGGLGLTAFGSTTNHVVQQATCPVLSLRA